MSSWFSSSNSGWPGWSSGSVTYTVYSDNTTNFILPSKIPNLTFEKSRYDIWLDHIFFFLEEGYEIDIVTGGVKYA